MADHKKQTIRVKDLAKIYTCSPQNIYRHLQIHREELKGHTFKGPGRQGTLLDAEACEFIRNAMFDKKRSEVPAILWNDDACLGYAIYAMEMAGLTQREISMVARMIPAVLNEKTWAEAIQRGSSHVKHDL